MLIHLLQLCIPKCQSIMLLFINADVKKNLYQNSTIEGAYFGCSHCFWKKFTQSPKYLVLNPLILMLILIKECI